MTAPDRARQPTHIRGTHRYHFRSGKWAELLMVAPAPDKSDCYVVRFPDGTKDWWVVNDSVAGYEFSGDEEVCPRCLGLLHVERERAALETFAAEMSGLISDMDDVPDPGLGDLPRMAETIRREYELAIARLDKRGGRAERAL